VALEQAYYNLKDNIDIKSHDGTLCNQIIFETYGTIYVGNLYDVLTDDIWSDSRCTDCLEFVISPQVVLSQESDYSTKAAGNYRYNNKTAKFLNLYEILFDCIEKIGGSSVFEDITKHNSSVVCKECWKAYEQLDLYYEESIMSKQDFCVDIDSAINDTIRFWRNTMDCELPALPAKGSEAVWVALISLAFFTVTILFYTGSFMQGSRRKRRLKKYRSLNVTYDSTGAASINSDMIRDYIHEETRRRPPSDRSISYAGGERTPLLFAGGRRVISYSQLPPSNLG